MYSFLYPCFMPLKKIPASFPAPTPSHFTQAIEYYKSTLTITAELNDTAGEGRAVGNLGNAYTAIGEYQEAIKYHERRLAIANAANDLVRGGRKRNFAQFHVCFSKRFK